MQKHPQQVQQPLGQQQQVATGPNFTASPILGMTVQHIVMSAQQLEVSVGAMSCVGNDMYCLGTPDLHHHLVIWCICSEL